MVTLRYFRDNDAELLQRNQFPHLDRQSVTAIIHEWNTLIHDGKRFEMFAIQSDEKVVGSISLYEHSKSIASPGIIVFPDVRQRGYASEAMRMLMEYAARLGYKALQSQIRTDNTVSIRLHEKLDFETDGYVYQNRRGNDILLYFRFL